MSPTQHLQTEEIFLSAEVLALIDPDWENMTDEDLSEAVGEFLEHAYWHWRWLLAVRDKRCKLVVVQYKNAQGAEMNPHYQIGEFFTLSGWHPERAAEEARSLVNGIGETFELPVDEDLLTEWEQLADRLGLAETLNEDENELDIMINAMLLLDARHDAYVQELGEDFYIATRGVAKDIDRLLADEFGQWSRETMQVVDKTATIGMAHIFLNPPDGNVPVVYQPEIVKDQDTRHAQGDA